MKSIPYSNIILFENQIRNFRHSERPFQRTVENNREGESTLDLKIRLGYSEPPSPAYNGKLKKTKIFIKNMVSIRCKILVKAVLENLGLNYSKVKLGEVKIIGNLSDAKHEQLRSDLLKCGLELMEDKKIILVEKIRKEIIQMIHYSDNLPNINFSDYLSEKLKYRYTFLSNLFSEAKGMSIQHFIILHKIERVKELLVYDEFTLSEIAYKLHYSSVAHLSNQFKKITNLTPSQFKNIKHKKRCTLDNI